MRPWFSKVACVVGLIPSAVVLALITADIIGIVLAGRAPMLAASAVTPVALVAFAWAAACAAIAFLATKRLAGRVESPDQTAIGPLAADPAPASECSGIDASELRD